MFYKESHHLSHNGKELFYTGDLVEYISNKIDENKKKNKVSENGINLKNSSNQKNKKLTQKQKQLEIEINHRKSGYYKQSLKFVSGGLPSLGKKK